MAEVFANSEDPDQTLHSVASDQGLHCLQITLLVSPDYNGLNTSTGSKIPRRHILTIVSFLHQYKTPFLLIQLF